MPASSPARSPTSSWSTSTEHLPVRRGQLGQQADGPRPRHRRQHRIHQPRRPRQAGRIRRVGVDHRFAVNEQHTQLVAIGNFTAVAGQLRQRAFLANLGETAATLDPWYYNSLTRPCSATVPQRQAYLTDVDFAPDGSYFVFVSTGFVPRAGEIGETRLRRDRPVRRRHRQPGTTGLDQLHRRRHHLVGVGHRRRGVRTRPLPLAQQPRRGEQRRPRRGGPHRE